MITKINEFRKIYENSNSSVQKHASELALKLKENSLGDGTVREYYGLEGTWYINNNLELKLTYDKHGYHIYDKYRVVYTGINLVDALNAIFNHDILNKP